MTDEQIAALLERLDHLAETANNMRGYLEYLAKQEGYGLGIEVETHEANSDEQYWNRLHEVGGADGTGAGILGGSKQQLELPNTLTDEEKAHVAAVVATRQAKARLEAKRSKPRRTKRRRR